MDAAHLALFLMASVLVIIAPGPDNVLVVTRGVALGRRAALVSAGGAATGLVLHSLLAAAGLSRLLERSATAYGAVKYIGAAYLIYLGVRALLNRAHLDLTVAPAPLSLRRVYTQAVASNVLNPKIVIFFLAYLPQFTTPGAGVIALQLLALGLTFSLLTWGIFSVIAYFSSLLGGWLRRRPRVASGLDRLTGGVFIALGLRLAFPERR